MEKLIKAYNIENKKKQYFIDRNGKVVKYKGDINEEIISMHSKIAHLLFPEKEFPLDYIVSEGWIMVGSSVYFCPVTHRKPTNKLKHWKDLNCLII